MNETNSGHVHDDTHTDYHAAKAMAEARMQRGVWQDRKPVPPWEWRKTDKDEWRRREASALAVE